jgi:hypothetical protein
LSVKNCRPLGLPHIWTKLSVLYDRTIFLLLPILSCFGRNVGHLAKVKSLPNMRVKYYNDFFCVCELNCIFSDFQRYNS